MERERHAHTRTHTTTATTPQLWVSLAWRDEANEVQADTRWVPARGLPKSVELVGFPDWGGLCVLRDGPDLLEDWIQNHPRGVDSAWSHDLAKATLFQKVEEPYDEESLPVVVTDQKKKKGKQKGGGKGKAKDMKKQPGNMDGSTKPDAPKTTLDQHSELAVSGMHATKEAMKLSQQIAAELQMLNKRQTTQAVGEQAEQLRERKQAQKDREAAAYLREQVAAFTAEKHLQEMREKDLATMKLEYEVRAAKLAVAQQIEKQAKKAKKAKMLADANEQMAEMQAKVDAATGARIVDLKENHAQTRLDLQHHTLHQQFYSNSHYNNLYTRHPDPQNHRPQQPMAPMLPQQPWHGQPYPPAALLGYQASAIPQQQHMLGYHQQQAPPQDEQEPPSANQHQPYQLGYQHQHIPPQDPHNANPYQQHLEYTGPSTCTPVLSMCLRAH